MSDEPTRVDPAHIAEAAVKAARVNHYLVGLVAVHEEDAAAAWQILIDWENAKKISGAVMDRAAYLLSEASGIPVDRLSG